MLFIVTITDLKAKIYFLQKEIEAIEQKEEPKRKRGRPKKFIETESLNTISLSKFKN